MELPETYCTIFFELVRQQNKMLLKEIALRENIPLPQLMKKFLPTRKDWRASLNRPSSSVPE